METIEIKTFIKTVGRRRFDGIKSQDIRRQYNVQEIGEWITKTDEWNEKQS
jgi:hypothetical protein